MNAITGSLPPSLVEASCVKLFALIAVGIFAVIWGRRWPGVEIFDEASPPRSWSMAADEIFGPRWVGADVPFCHGDHLPAAAVPGDSGRDASTNDHLAARPRGLFPLYLFGMISIFIVPIADCQACKPSCPMATIRISIVLTLPLAISGRERTLALCVAFLGGFSSATSMVIVVLPSRSPPWSRTIIVMPPISIRLMSAGRETSAGDLSEPAS